MSDHRWLWVLAAAVAGAVSGAVTPHSWYVGWTDPRSPEAWQFLVPPLAFSLTLILVSRAPLLSRLLYPPLLVGAWLLAMSSLEPLSKLAEFVGIYGSGGVGGLSVGIASALVERWRPKWWVFLLFAAAGAAGNLAGMFVTNYGAQHAWFALWQALVAAVIVWARERGRGSAPAANATI